MHGRLVARFRLVALVILEVAAIPLLGGSGAGTPADIDWARLGHWLATTPPEDAVTAVVRLAGMALAAWLLATTVLYLLARLTRAAALMRGVEWATLPAVRKVVDGAVAASIVGSALVGAHPAGAQTPAPPPIVVELSTTTTVPAEHLYVPVAAGDTAPTPGATSPTVGPVAASTAPPAPATTTMAPAPVTGAPTARDTEGQATPPAVAPAEVHVHRVVAGDNLWRIAAADLGRQRGRGREHLAEAEIRRHWLKVMAANQGRLRSGDPNLIYPGETIVCPPPD